MTTGALNIKDVYRGIYTENINGMMSHNDIDITADTVDISSTQIGGATGDHPAAIYGMGDNDKNAVEYNQVRKKEAVEE